MAYVENANVLKKTEYSPNEWARKKAQLLDDENPSTLPELEEIENARRCLLKYIRNEYQPGQEEEWKDRKQALDALIFCIQFDKANALHLMKIVRDDPDCPRGMPWCTVEDFDSVKEKMEALPGYQELCKRHNNQVSFCNTITKKYREFAEAHHADDVFMVLLDELLKPELPFSYCASRYHADSDQEE